jgi:hypothetical protein
MSSSTFGRASAVLSAVGTDWNGLRQDAEPIDLQLLQGHASSPVTDHLSAKILASSGHRGMHFDSTAARGRFPGGWEGRFVEQLQLSTSRRPTSARPVPCVVDRLGIRSLFALDSGRRGVP